MYFVGVWYGISMVYSVNLNGDIKKLIDGMYDYGLVVMVGDKIIIKCYFISVVDEIYIFIFVDG